MPKGNITHERKRYLRMALGLSRNTDVSSYYGRVVTAMITSKKDWKSTVDTMIESGTLRRRRRQKMIGNSTKIAREKRKANSKARTASDAHKVSPEPQETAALTRNSEESEKVRQFYKEWLDRMCR